MKKVIMIIAVAAILVGCKGGDMEIAIKIDDNDLGSEPIVVKSTVYEQLYIVKS